MTSSPFHSRAFTTYWVGGLFSNSGTWLHNVTASVVMLQLTGSPFMVGVLNFAGFAPIFLFSFVGGVVADRVDRRHVVTVCSSLSLVVGLAISAATAVGKLTPLTLLFGSALLGSSYSFAKPALSAMLPAVIAPSSTNGAAIDLAHATAVNTLQFTIGQVVGSLASASILAVASPQWAFGVNGLTYLAPITAMLVLRRILPRGGERPRRSGLQSLREGVVFVVGKGGLRPVLVAILLTNGAVESLRTLAPTFTERALQASAEDAGLLVAGISVGSVIGASSFGLMSRWLHRGTMTLVAFGLQAAGVVICAGAPSLPISVVAAVPIGLGFALLVPMLSATMQERSPDALRARVMSAFAMVHLGLRPVLSLLAGALGSAVGARGALIAAVIFAALGLLVLRGGSVLSAAPRAQPHIVAEP